MKEQSSIKSKEKKTDTINAFAKAIMGCSGFVLVVLAVYEGSELVSSIFANADVTVLFI